MVISLDSLTLEDGKYLVKLARRAIEEYLRTGRRIMPEDVPPRLLEEGAAFVTLLTYPHRELRGCIGYVEPIKPLAETVVDVAIAAATSDPRFYPVSLDEMDHLVVEVSVLGDHETYSAREALKKIKIGETGIIIRRGPFSGVLLPEVPVEYCWDEETFIAETCIKAGLPPDCWLDEGTQATLFRGRTWTELSPRGEVVERDLKREYIERCLNR
ncbi:TIGR00296 family protein [Ignicoccus islandicus]|uniref:TIGR00296 family protein n=1 Tax=Ignicoccus islandicus TaxID=54259 RepID=UPI0009462A47|nr:TIGR00296 family protein [Ignicoccus islandicus]